MLVSQLVSRKPVTVDLKTSIKDATKVMRREGVGSLVIVDNDFRPVGIVTERDIVYAIAQDIPIDTPISEIMSRDPVSINGGSDVSEAVALMTSRGIRHLVVINNEGRTIGVISVRDVVKAVGAIALDLAFW
ncbi:conserved CBS domain protein [Sulfolobus acidocaldarius DSM 639]|uniref:Conserved CBS domain protein n=1 Tax=Sulfolobus acidocaldarius (strain ATCC 33909 / DSM 639 / JCM 8929 / NBRC 15157 / NCIMB 11770) TaxID=330779 RepID=Q4JBX5_SULAC|nr:conserved CBS domain protein [Sulfolobus acidocaldarius DSM 639]AHC50788.1 histidine kinase [Sulfolobus acidocaldarius SUSAZ]